MLEKAKNNNSGKNDNSVCPHHQVCSGCHFWDRPWAEQKHIKTADLEKHLVNFQVNLRTPIEYIEIAPAGLRDRLDFTLEDSKLGLYHKHERQIVDLPECYQLSPALQAWLSEFRGFKWDLKKASFRLRTSPAGQRGLWIDCANIDIKNLLEEKNLLKKLQEICFVEIGQRRKVPVWTQDQFKLKDPEAHPWFETWLDDDTALPLYCQVASFTQPSLKANKKLTAIIRRWIERSDRGAILEFGSGIGNLTFPAATFAEKLTACEVDPLALNGLERSLKELPSRWQHLKNKIEIFAGDFQRKLKTDFSNYQTVLVNPPRSGLLNFLDPLVELSEKQRPGSFIYMSCYPESLCADLKRLEKLGYQIQEIMILDQFPQSQHYEVLCDLRK